MHTEQAVIAREVYRIAEELMNLSMQDEKGVYWITPAPDIHSKSGESIDLFNGSAGIILFFLSLYRYQPDRRYLDVCTRAADRLLQHMQIQQPAYYTFYGGATGVLYLCIQLYKVTGDDAYIRKAIELEKCYRQGFDKRVTQHDLLSGQAGILLAVSHLYACSKDASLLQTIHYTIQKLVEGAHITPSGLKWDVCKHGFDSLTGFSHGASGIAFALLQTGYYFNAPGLIYLANQALLYETNYYDDHTGNYFDLRVGMARMQTLRQQYGSELLNWPLPLFQPTMSGISSWAHGAAGCALTRLFAFEFTGNHEYAEKAHRPLEYSWTYCIQQQRTDYSLCSGYGGIAMVFQQAGRILKQPVWHNRSQHIAHAAIDYYKKQHTYNSKLTHYITDPGLFSGLAGIGYWLLGCLQLPAHDSILHPALVNNYPEFTGINNIADSFTTTTVKQSIYTRYYPETFRQIHKKVIKETCQAAVDIHALEILLKEYSNKSHQTALPAVFKKEKQVACLWKQHKGFLQYRQRRILLQPFIEQCMKWPDEDWLQLELVKATHIVVIDPDNELYYCHEKGISNVKISRLTALLLDSFRKRQRVGTVIAAIQQRCFSHENKVGTIQPILLQVKELVKAGFLIGE